MAKTKTIENLFHYLDLYSDLIPIILLLVYLRKSKSEKGLMVIGFYCLFSFIIKYTLSYFPYNPLEVTIYATFTFVEYSLFAYFLFLNIKKASVKKALLYTSIVFCLFIIIYYLTVKFSGLDSIPIGLETILILGFSFYYLFEQMNDTSNLFIYSKYPFWIILGILLYLAGSFFIYIFAGELNTAEIAKYWIFTNIFSILKNIFFVIAIVINSNLEKAKKTYPSMYNLN